MVLISSLKFSCVVLIILIVDNQQDVSGLNALSWGGSDFVF